jgi:hypothetical protein
MFLKILYTEMSVLEVIKSYVFTLKILVTEKSFGRKMFSTYSKFFEKLISTLYVFYERRYRSFK